MNLIGIDVGSDSVRASVRDGVSGAFTDLERALTRKVDGNKHTMSGPGLWAHIVSMLVEYDEAFSFFSESNAKNCEKSGISIPANDETCNFHESAGKTGPSKTPSSLEYSVCVAATCSMVVMNRIKSADGIFRFEPVTPDEEIIVWMDTRAKREAHDLSQRLPKTVLAHIGGTVTPEMGVAKLKWVSDNLQTDSSSICVFELYDWVSYVFLAGGYNTDGSVAGLPNDIAKFSPNSMAMDGSVKGWGQDILESLGITATVCGVPNSYSSSSCFPYVGTLLGKFRNLNVAHGCIDCYAGWAGQVACSGASLKSKNDENSVSSSLMVVAGTSTCFIASVNSKKGRNSSNLDPVIGIWGPFPQLLPSPIYSFGQPATGQLFAELFAEFADIIGENEAFGFVVGHILTFESKYATSLSVLARHYFYYGDKHGNRSPFGDFRLGEITVDGKNASHSDTFQCSVHEKTIESLVLRYYLIIEFLVFQTKFLCSKVEDTCGVLSDVYISGSQAHNELFVRMLDKFAFPYSSLFVQNGVNNKYAGSQGIALSMISDVDETEEEKIKIENTWFKVEPTNISGGDVGLNREAKVLSAKYKAFVEMAHWQKQFHDTMGSL